MQYNIRKIFENTCFQFGPLVVMVIVWVILGVIIRRRAGLLSRKFTFECYIVMLDRQKPPTTSIVIAIRGMVTAQQLPLIESPL
jgi:hypothetical protein